MKKRLLIGVLVLLATVAATVFVLASAGLFWFVTLDRDAFGREKAVKFLNPRRETSLKKWSSRRIGNENATEYAQVRTSRVIRGRVSPGGNPHNANLNGKEFADHEDEQDHTTFDGGTATAITSDGYWLTAAHVVSDAATLTLHGFDSNNQAKRHPARLVWIGKADDPNAPDLALIYCSHAPTRHFPLLRPEVPSPDTEVLSAGYGGGHPGQAAGKILRLGPPQGAEPGPRWRIFFSDAPMMPGDSGGPLISADGQLVGINFGIRYNIGIRINLQTRYIGWSVNDFHAKTLSPDTDWIRKLIIKDRAESKEERKVSLPTNNDG